MKTKNSLLTIVAIFAAWATAPLAVATLQDEIATFHEVRQELVNERRALAEQLRDTTPAERRAVIEQYQADNAERIANHQAMGERIRQAVSGFRPERDQNEPPPAAPISHSLDVDTALKAFQLERDTLLQAQRALLDELKDATEEERREAMTELREARKKLIEDQRELARSLRDEKKERNDARRNDAVNN